MISLLLVFVVGFVFLMPTPAVIALFLMLGLAAPVPPTADELPDQVPSASSATETEASPQ